MDDNRLSGATEEGICYLPDPCAVYDYGMCFVPLCKSEGFGPESHFRLSAGSSCFCNFSDLVCALVS